MNNKDIHPSWSLESGSAAARSTQAGDSWIGIKLAGDKITTPVMGEQVCAFYCDNKAYAFSAKVDKWDEIPIESPTEERPSIVIDAESATIQTNDDIQRHPDCIGHRPY